MIDLKSLPREPKAALRSILVDLLELVPKQDRKLSELATANCKIDSRIQILAKAATISASRSDDSTLANLARRNLKYLDSQIANSYRNDIETVLEALIAVELDQHFINQENVTEFDQVTLSEDEKTELFEVLSQARRLTQSADYLSDEHKRRIAHRISDVENELHKEIVGFKAFLAVAADVSGLVNRFGEDAKPLAEAIQAARTITERKVEGYRKIEQQDKLKQLPSPDEDG